MTREMKRMRALSTIANARNVSAKYLKNSGLAGHMPRTVLKLPTFFNFFQMAE